MDRLSGSVRRLLPAVQLLERMVSEIPRTPMVHTLPERAADSLATVFHISGRRMVCRNIPHAHTAARIDSFVCYGPARRQCTPTEV